MNALTDLTLLQKLFILMLLLFLIGWSIWGYTIWQRSRIDTE